MASSLRLIQVYTDVKSYGASEGQNIVNKIYKHLISQNYYEKVRALADARSAILYSAVFFYNAENFKTNTPKPSF